MTCIELCVIGQKLSITLKMRIGYHGFPKNSRHTHQNWLKSSPVWERSAYSLQNYVCFSLLTSGLESFGHKSTPSHRPWIEAYYLRGLECRKVNFLEYHGQGTRGCHSLSSLLFRRFSSPINIHTHCSYWHWTSTSLHSIGFINSFHFFLFFSFFFLLSPKRILQSTAWPHQSTARPLERVASYIKVTRPPCLFQLPPWENVNRSTIPIYHMWVTSSH